MVINKNTRKIYKFCVLQFVLFSFKFIGIASHIIAESSIILAKYFPFSQLHVAGFQT